MVALLEWYLVPLLNRSPTHAPSFLHLKNTHPECSGVVETRCTTCHGQSSHSMTGNGEPRAAGPTPSLGDGRACFCLRSADENIRAARGGVNTCMLRRGVVGVVRSGTRQIHGKAQPPATECAKSSGGGGCRRSTGCAPVTGQKRHKSDGRALGGRAEDRGGGWEMGDGGYGGGEGRGREKGTFVSLMGGPGENKGTHPARPCAIRFDANAAQICVGNESANKNWRLSVCSHALSRNLCPFIPHWMRPDHLRSCIGVGQ